MSLCSSVCLSLSIYKVSRKILHPKSFLNIIFKNWKFLTHILHTYSAIKSTPNYNILFNYFKIWWSYAILCTLTQKIFHFHSKAHCTDLTVKYEWPPNSPNFNHLTINVCGAMLQTFYKLKAEDHAGAKAALQQIQDDLLQTFAISSEYMCFCRW